MSKTAAKYFFSVLLTAALFSCSGVTTKEDATDDSIYTPSYIREYGSTNYEEAMRLADQAMEKGRLSALKTYELKANLTYQYTEDYDAAASYMNKALVLEGADDPDVRTDLLYYLATIYRTAKQFAPCIETCAEGKELAHRAGRIYDMHAFDFLAGSCLWSMGEDEAGLQRMKEAIAGASAAASSEAQYGHLAHFVNKLSSVYIEAGEYNSALEQCTVYEKLLNTMKEKFPGTSATFQDRSRFYLEMDRAVCFARTGRSEKAHESFLAACERNYASTEGGKIRMTFYYAAAGDPSSVLRIYTQECPYSNPDTVTREYRGRLARIRDAYKNAGMEEEYALALARYNKLDELLEAREKEEGFQEKAWQYDSQHYRLALGDAIKALGKNRLLFIVMIVLAIVSLAALFFLNRRYNLRKEEQYRKDTLALEKDIRSLRRQVSLIAKKDLITSGNQEKDKSGLSLAELIEGNNLYLNKNLNRENAAALLGLSQSDITRMLQEIQPDLSFPDYVKGLRLRYAIKLLGENPAIPVSELADRSGFYSVRTFQRSFLTLTGKTPSEYAKDLKGSSLI